MPQLNFHQEFHKYAARVAQLNGATDGFVQFNTEPAIAQRFLKKVQESNDFLSRINMLPVQAAKGEVLRIASKPVTSRSGNDDREVNDKGQLSDNEFNCNRFEANIPFKYDTLAAWNHVSGANGASFQQILRDQTAEQIGRDLIMIGFNGTSSATKTNYATNQKLQDVAKGWLSKIGEKSERRMNRQKIGNISNKNPDYSTLDAAVRDAITLLDEPFRGRNDLVVICNHSMLNDRKVQLFDDAIDATERQASNLLASSMMVGGLPTVSAPFFPENAFLVTFLKNLSIYTVSGMSMRVFHDEPKRNQYVDYHTDYRDFVVEDFGAVGLFNNIRLPNDAGTDFTA